MDNRLLQLIIHYFVVRGRPKWDNVEKMSGPARNLVNSDRSTPPELGERSILPGSNLDRGLVGDIIDGTSRHRSEKSEKDENHDEKSQKPNFFILFLLCS